MEFRDRLRLAAKHAGVEYSQTAIARSLKIGKQTVDRWMADGMPSAEMLYHIADTWKVNPRWLAVEQEEMIPAPPVTDAKLKSRSESDAEKLLAVLRTFLDTDAEGKDEFLALANSISALAHGAQPTAARRTRRR